MTSHLRAAIRGGLLVGMTLLLLPVYFIVGREQTPAGRRVVRLWHQGACCLTGLRVNAVGDPVSGAPVLLACNHISYLDIPVLASKLNATFVAKSDVARWPGIGFLARLAGTIFVDREAARASRQVDQISARLRNNRRVIIFPEGTSSEGDAVLPYKSSLFQAAAGVSVKDAAVQPVTIGYVHGRDGIPLGRPDRRSYAWVGDDTLIPHLWQVLRRPGIQVDVIFHPAVEARFVATRKEMADHCRRHTVCGLASLNRRAKMVGVPTAPGPGLWSEWQDFPAFSAMD